MIAEKVSEANARDAELRPFTEGVFVARFIARQNRYHAHSVGTRERKSAATWKLTPKIQPCSRQYAALVVPTVLQAARRSRRASSGTDELSSPSSTGACSRSERDVPTLKATSRSSLTCD
jgi:hypothetical protein